MSTEQKLEAINLQIKKMNDNLTSLIKVMKTGVESINKATIQGHPAQCTCNKKKSLKEQLEDSVIEIGSTGEVNENKQSDK